MTDGTEEITISLNTKALEELEERFGALLNRQERVRYCIEAELQRRRAED